MTTAGAGWTNAVTGIATAFCSESPILHIDGQGAFAQRRIEAVSSGGAEGAEKFARRAIGRASREQGASRA